MLYAHCGVYLVGNDDNECIDGEEEDEKLTDDEKVLLIHALHRILKPFILRREKEDVEKCLPDKVGLYLISC